MLYRRVAAFFSRHYTALRTRTISRVKSAQQKTVAVIDEGITRSIRASIRTALRVTLGVKAHGLENFKGLEGKPLVIVANHTSLLDGVVLAAMLPVRPAFAIATDQFEKFNKNPLVRFLFKRLTILPIDPTKPQALKTMTQLAKSGTPVMIFPEGRLTSTGNIMQIFDGAGAIADGADATIVPVYLKGLNMLPFGTLGLQNYPRRLRPEITVTALLPRTLDIPDSATARVRRKLRLDALERIMYGLPVEALESERALFDDFKAAAYQFGRKRVTVEDPMRNRLTYGQVMTGAYALGAKLAKETQAKETVGFFLPNSNAAAVSFWALQAYGRVPAMLNASSDAPTLQSCVTTAGVKTIITSRTFIELAKLEDKIAALGEKARIIYLEDVKTSIGTKDKLTALARSRGALPSGAPKITGGDPAVVLFTSGSEGPPKGVVLSHTNIRANIAQVSATAPITPADKVFNALPVFHSFGLGGGLIMPMLRGIPSVQYPTPLDGKNIPKAIYWSDATLMFATDTFLRLYAKGTDNNADMSRLRFIFAGAEALTQETRDTYLNRFGVRIYEGYGMTEASPVVAINLPGKNEHGTVGRLLPGLEARLEPVADMDDGFKLLIKGPNVMMGYLRPENPGVIEAPVDGWHDTGDIVRMTAQGHLQIAGRAKRFAKVGGEMVSLDAIETIARTASPQTEQAVILRQQPGKADEIILYTTDAAMKRETLATAAKSLSRSFLGLPGNDNIRVVGEIPKLATGKTDYVSLKKLDAAFNAAAQPSQATPEQPASAPKAAAPQQKKG